MTRPGQQLGPQPGEAKLALVGLARSVHGSQGSWRIPFFPPATAKQRRSEDSGLSLLEGVEQMAANGTKKGEG